MKRYFEFKIIGVMGLIMGLSTSALALDLNNALYRLTIQNGPMTYLPTNNSSAGTVISSAAGTTSRYVVVKASSGSIKFDSYDYISSNCITLCSPPRWTRTSSVSASVYGLNRGVNNLVRVGVVGRSGVSFVNFCLEASNPNLKLHSYSYASGTGSNRGVFFADGEYGIYMDADLPSGSDAFMAIVDVAPASCVGSSQSVGQI